MATTTNYGWTTPDDTALVKDGASAIRSLGSSIDTTLKAQIDAQIPDSIMDAKGDLISATADNTPARLASSGVNGDVLQVDTSTTTGLKWAAPASGGMTLISTTTLTGASITLSSIPGTYTHLQLIIQNFRPDTDSRRIRMRFNGDSNTRYSGSQPWTSQGGTIFGEVEMESVTPSVDNLTSQGISIIDVPNYANTTTWKFAKWFSIGNDPTTSTSWTTTLSYNIYNQTPAITSITLYPNTGNFSAGTVLLYGVK